MLSTLLSLAALGPLTVGAVALAIVPLGLVTYSLRQRHRLKQRITMLRSEWGQASSRTRDLETLGEFHQISPLTEDDSRNQIDDQTWSDLNMNAVFARVDRTFTTAGECTLNRVLRTPLTSPDALAPRGQMIRLFQEDVATREALQIELLPVGRSNARGLISLVWTDAPSMQTSPSLYYLLTILAIASLISVATVGGALSAMGVLIMFLVNMAMHYRTKSQLMGRLAALRQLGAMIRAGERIVKIEHLQLAAHTAPLARAAHATRRIARKVSLLTPEGSSAGDVIASLVEYISIFFLHEVRTFQSAMADIASHREELRTLFRLIGELDAWQSVASFRAGLSSYCEPQFNDDGPRLIVTDARHPLLDDAVPNSIEIHSWGIAITGSNMSGKTTFLRTIGVNALLAQTTFTCVANEYRGRVMRIASSMNESDDLIEGKSYYLAEAERLLTMVRASEGDGLLLALIDEPLAGTNSPERLAASREILRYLASHNALVLVSTHDVELVWQLQADREYEAYHFSDEANENGIRFDYLLRRGLDYHGNAIKVLKFLGYPSTIIDQCESFSSEPIPSQASRA